MEAKNNHQIDPSKGEYEEPGRILDKDEPAEQLTKQRFLEKCEYAFDNCGGVPLGAMISVATETGVANLMEGVFSGQSLATIAGFIDDQGRAHMQRALQKRGLDGTMSDVLAHILGR